MSKIDLPPFTLGETITPEQRQFFTKNGVIVFRNFIRPETIQLFISETQRIEKQWLDEKRDKVNGIPLKFGQDQNDKPMIQRMCFLSQYSTVLHEFLNDPRLQAVVDLLQPYDGRIAEVEKDGLIMNHYVRTPNSKFSQMGWHTDSPRDIFLGQRIMPMLNVGIHLNDTPYENGGLRVIPGTHKQGIIKMLFRKKYFVDNDPDKAEIGFDINAGDLSVHDGRLWHRAQQSPHVGEASRRRVMYVPIVTGKYMPKNEHSKTPFYHRFISKVNI